MLLEPGIDASYESIRRWTGKFEPRIARNLRKRQARLGDVWHLDEAVVKIAGKSSGSGARSLLSSLPDIDWLLGDRGYDAEGFREALKDKGIRAWIPGRKQRKKPAKDDKRRYKRRNRIEIMFGRFKD